MRYYIAAFRSRNQTMVFSQILSSYNIKNRIINTPRMATVSCGLSVRFEEKDLSYVRQVLARRNFSGFAGLFMVVQNGVNQVVSKV